MVGHKDPPKEHQFKPGQSGNPNGRPKGIGIEAQLRLLLEFVMDDCCPLTGMEGQTAGALLNAQLVAKAVKEGDLKAIDMVYDRLEGKAVARNKDVSDPWKELIKDD